MSKLTILVDFDDVMNNFCEVWIDELNNLYGTNVKLEDVTDWDIKPLFPKVSKNQLYMPLYWDEFWRKVKPKVGAVEGLKTLVDQGHDVVVVTAAAPETIAPKTRNVLFKYFPFLTNDNLIVTSRKDLIRGDVIIDDAPHNLESSHCCVKILVSAPHNKEVNARYCGYIRVSDWDQICSVVARVYKG